MLRHRARYPAPRTTVCLAHATGIDIKPQKHSLPRENRNVGHLSLVHRLDTVPVHFCQGASCRADHATIGTARSRRSVNEYWGKWSLPGPVCFADSVWNQPQRWSRRPPAAGGAQPPRHSVAAGLRGGRVADFAAMRIVYQRNLTRDLAGKQRRLGEDYLRQPPAPRDPSQPIP
jgi:hypothetical protein